MFDTVIMNPPFGTKKNKGKPWMTLNREKFLKFGHSLFASTGRRSSALSRRSFILEMGPFPTLSAALDQSRLCIWVFNKLETSRRQFICVCVCVSEVMTPYCDVTERRVA